MPIPNKHLEEVVFLSELELNCSLFNRAFSALQISARHRINLDNGIDDEQPGSPILIVEQCTVCLSALAAIRRILSPVSTKPRTQERASRLRDLLDSPSLPHVTTVAVRNSWEHLDERLDAVLVERATTSGPVEQLSVSSRTPNPNSFVLRRFDPTTFAIQFAGDAIPLLPCVDEIKELKARIDKAYEKLNIDE
ncbi:hypothetical protein [Massilia orientalis]|uniref:Uncharacterized protein n=1 Tax=Massilia orientalis TaxID=3050128 RepID=A0ACC7MF75_9BURK|nr:hypothetical protein [Massilia sp. YIM B02787]